MKYLIDTNVLSELPKRAPDPAVLEWFAGQCEVVVSAITLEELVFGIRRSSAALAEKLQRWLDKLRALPLEVVPVDEEIARLSGVLRAMREKSGRRVEQADMLIAATAIRTGRALVTRNTRDFEGCGVSLLNPFSDELQDR